MAKLGKAESCAGLVSFKLPYMNLLWGKDLEIPVLSLTCHLTQPQTVYCDFNHSFLLLTAEYALTIMASYQYETPINAFDSPVFGTLLASSCLRTESTGYILFTHSLEVTGAQCSSWLWPTRQVLCPKFLLLRTQSSIRFTHVGGRRCKDILGLLPATPVTVCKAQSRVKALSPLLGSKKKHRAMGSQPEMSSDFDHDLHVNFTLGRRFEYQSRINWMVSQRLKLEAKGEDYKI